MRFMDLTQPEYSYMFAFLQADGSLSAGRGDKGKLAVELARRDHEILLRFQELCPFPSSVRDRTRNTNFKDNHQASTWTMCSFEGRMMLFALGMPYGRKSKIIRPPTGPHQARDYVRGLVDADGSVGFTAKGLPFVGLTTSSDEIARYFAEFCSTVSGAERNPGRNRRDDVYNILYTGEPAPILAEHLYYEGALALRRKSEVACGVRAWRRPKDMRAPVSRRKWTDDEDAVVVAHPPAVAAELLNRTERSCAMRTWRLLGPAKPRVRFPK
ncbi:LAGLIDADG family homing endonuclease [Yinghuangia sp. YIM S09857]|uniref:LAGLIDADG family homing endonuclease n=1 Tax=Yinghuangia sp. YIM S09857 TaxID=3436929 RepID=UPI003F531B90